MNKALLTITIYFIGSIFLFPSLVKAAECSPVGKCGYEGGCQPGQICTSFINPGEPDACRWDSVNCPLPPLACNLNSVVACQNKNAFDFCGDNSICTPESIFPGQASCLCTEIPPSPTSTPTPTTQPTGQPTPIPTLPPIESLGEPCSSVGKNTIYPPNSSCYAEVKNVESNITEYPLTCIAAPEASYKKTETVEEPPTTVDVSLTTDLSKLTLGFLGPDSKTIGTTNSDNLSKTYLFSGLFDRPSFSAANTPREVFRTYWRMLDSRIQANLKAIYLEATNTDSSKLNYYYLDSNLKQQEIDTKTLFGQLPICLRKFPVCDDYAKKYNALPKNVKIRYDTLLPFDFNDNRSYIALNGAISKESIPYLSAILNALSGNNSLFSFYTPSSLLLTTPKANTISAFSEGSLYSTITAKDLLSTCVTPTKTTSAPAPYTYPNSSSLSQTVTIPLQSKLISQTPDSCWCNAAIDPECPYSCSSYSDDQYTCEMIGCYFTEGEKTWELTGKASGRHATVFNNPLINNLNSVVIGSGQPGEPSFYRMIVPSFAKAVEKKLVSAPATNVDTADPDTTISKNKTAPAYRENALAQTAMHLIQSCWLVPSSMQSSSMCGVLKDIELPVSCDNCSSTFPTAAFVKANYKERYIDIANRWIGAGTPLAEQNFDQVVDAAEAAGVNPAFALSSWLLESGTSNYDGVCLKLGGGNMSSTYCNHLLDFGINKDEIASNYAEGKFFFNEQLKIYLGLPYWYKDVCKKEMEASSCPMRVFTAMFFVGECKISADSDRYYAAIKNIYENLITQGDPLPCYPVAYP